MERIIVGISVGDVNGIGTEVILKTLSDKRVLKHCMPVIFGSMALLRYYLKDLNLEMPKLLEIQTLDDIEEDVINVFPTWTEHIDIKPGEQSETGGKYAFASLKAAVDALKNEDIEVLVTAPIHKKAMQMAGFDEMGHTEYLTRELDSKESLMLLTTEDLRVALVTGHKPIADVAKSLSKDLIVKKLALLRESLIIDFDISQPKIAVLGLNPHAGDDGLIGNEEKTFIAPAIEEARQKGIMAFGPYAADGFFGNGTWKKFDAVLSMYHDQGLGPFKALSFGEGVNYTCGLKAIRTSPDHGTGFDIAGTGVADPSSFRRAMYLAIEAFRNREAYHFDRSNPIKRSSRSKSKAMKEGKDEVLRDHSH